ncbi:MAG: DUF4012 domain-containing protein [Anaerolineae bacterium]|nr:DUF4012 domain-containing protein [Anaerolineae bacterium]
MKSQSIRLGVKVLLLVVALVVAVGGGLVGFRVFQHARAAWLAAQAIEPLARQAVAHPGDVQTLRALSPHLAVLDVELTALRDMAMPFFPVMRRLEDVPGAGREISAAPDLLDAAVELTVAARVGLEAGLPILDAIAREDAPRGDGTRLDVLASALPLLEETTPAWNSVGEHLERANVALQRVDTSCLPPPWGGRLRRLQQLLPQALAAARVLPYAPDLLGARGKRAYLIIAQNSDELRPTGGFISGVGVVQVSGGKLTSLTFYDSYAVDNLDQPHPPAPEALQRYLDAQILFLRDANWSPDFPTSARVIQSLYRLDQGVETYGVIAFDLPAVQQIVAALAPLRVPGVKEPLTGDNVLGQIKAAWEQPAEGLTIDRDWKAWWRKRKSFMPALVQAAMQRLTSGDVDWVRLAMAVRQAADERHILIYLDQPVAQEAITALGWDGGLHPGDHDYLAVIDANVGYNKVNAAVTRRMDYSVAYRDGGWIAHLTLTYTHSLTASLTTCVHRAVYGHTYEDMVRRCYWDYVRVYVPDGSHLIEADGLEPQSVREEPGEQGTWVIAGHFVMRPGTEHVVRFTYQLPDRVVSGGRYELRVQKQPGLVSLPFRLDFTGPPDTVWVLADGEPGQHLRRDLILRRDITLRIQRSTLSQR